MSGVGRLFVQHQLDHLFDFPRRKRLAARGTRGVLQKSVDALGGIASAPAPPHREHTFAHAARDLAPALMPAPASITIRARQTTFCGVLQVLRSLTSFPKRSRSSGATAMRSILPIQQDSHL
jgi:hypothetical protein